MNLVSVVKPLNNFPGRVTRVRALFGNGQRERSIVERAGVSFRKMRPSGFPFDFTKRFLPVLKFSHPFEHRRPFVRGISDERPEVFPILLGREYWPIVFLREYPEKSIWIPCPSSSKQERGGG